MDVVVGVEDVDEVNADADDVASEVKTTPVDEVLVAIKVDI